MAAVGLQRMRRHQGAEVQLGAVPQSGVSFCVIGFIYGSLVSRLGSPYLRKLSSSDGSAVMVRRAGAAAAAAAAAP